MEKIGEKSAGGGVGAKCIHSFWGQLVRERSAEFPGSSRKRWGLQSGSQEREIVMKSHPDPIILDGTSSRFIILDEFPSRFNRGPHESPSSTMHSEWDFIQQDGIGMESRPGL